MRQGWLAVACVFVALLAGCGTSHLPGESFKDCDGCPEMVVVPAGSFVMGSPADEEGHTNNEGPQHLVTIPRPFAVGKYEVTRGEYSAFARETVTTDENTCFAMTADQDDPFFNKSWRDPGFAQTDRDPVVCVNWEDAKAYVTWLSRKTGKPYRLPTEAEWEYAARARTTTPFHFGEIISTDMAKYDLTQEPRGTAPVGSFPSNSFGLHDVHGNVWEWVEDVWHHNYEGAPEDGSVRIKGENTSDRLFSSRGDRVLRSGSWFSIPRTLRSAYRFPGLVHFRYYRVGFRVVRTLDGAAKGPDAGADVPGRPDELEAGVAAYDRGDYATALREWRPLAEQGDAKAQNNLGDMYYKGQGVSQDYAEAAKCYRKATEQRFVSPFISLGLMLAYPLDAHTH